MNVYVLTIRYSTISRILWHALFYIAICYNFHRYIFKYSHGAFAKDDYQQTPITWQAGKYVLVIIIMSLIYMNSRFTRHLPKSLAVFYLFIAIILIINVVSAALYHEVMTDELEYIIFSLIILPLGFVQRADLTILSNDIDKIFNISQYIFIASNWIVIFNYFAFRIIPFHAYEGVLMRFGGLWDDPNTFAIVSVLFMGFALIRKQYLLLILHALNTLLTISLNGYLLLLVFTVYFILNNKRRILYISLFLLLIALISILVLYNINYAIQIYEAKRESIEQHASFSQYSLFLIPLLQPIQFHETWLLSENLNYFPFSIPLTLSLVGIFVYFFLFEKRNLQRLMFILFFVTSLFLPFLYMFPVNFMALLFLVLYTKDVQF